MGRFVSLFAALFACLAVAATAQQCSSSNPCANNLCCSQWGYCGTTAPYCDPAQGCQSNCWPILGRHSAFNSCMAAVAPNQQLCSPSNPCANNLCCSQWGYCGTTAEYCDPNQGCQDNCWPLSRARSAAKARLRSAPNQQCSSSNECPDNFCCQSGYCSRWCYPSKGSKLRAPYE